MLFHPRLPPDSKSVRFGDHPIAFPPTTLKFENYLIGTAAHVRHRAAHALKTTVTGGGPGHGHPSPPPPPPPPPVILPTPPPTLDQLAALLANFPGESLTSMMQVDGNDNYNDCLIAMASHIYTAWEMAAKRKTVLTYDQCVAEYLLETGGQDVGLNMLNVVNRWQSLGLFNAASKISAYVQVSKTDLNHIKVALEMFYALGMSFTVQTRTVTDYWSGATWQLGTSTTQGHAVTMLRYDANGIGVATWGNTATGLLQNADWGWLGCVRYIIAALPPQALEPGWNPNFDGALLKADLPYLAN